MMAEDVAKDFSKYLDHSIHNKLKPMNKMIEGMLARMEEFETMVNFAKQDVNDSIEALSSLTDVSNQLLELFSKIDTVEKVVNHLKGNLSVLESDMEKAELKLKLSHDSKLVSNIITPLLFRKPIEKKTVTTTNSLFDTNNYFENGNIDNKPNM